MPSISSVTRILRPSPRRGGGRPSRAVGLVAVALAAVLLPVLPAAGDEPDPSYTGVGYLYLDGEVDVDAGTFTMEAGGNIDPPLATSNGYETWFDLSGSVDGTWPGAFCAVEGFTASTSGTFNDPDGRTLNLFDVTVTAQQTLAPLDTSDEGYLVGAGRWSHDGHTGSFALTSAINNNYAFYNTSCLFTGSGFIGRSFAFPTLGQANRYVFTGGTPSDAMEVLGGLVDIGPPGFGSEQCEANGGDRIIDSTSLNVRTFVYTYQPTTDEVWLCARVEDTTTGEGYGGRLEATPTNLGGGGGPPPAPSTDSASTACTTTTDPPNQVPGSHPISQGGVATVDYMVDAYANDDAAWVCLQVGSSDHRVVVPLGGSGTSFGTVATWYPDEGTPTP